MELQAADPNYQARVKALFKDQPFGNLLGVTLTAIQPGFVEFALALRPELNQQQGLLHGGVTASLLDICGGGATATLLAPEEDLVTIEIKVNYLKRADAQAYRATGQVRRKGRQIVFCELAAFTATPGSKAQCIATGQCTYMIFRQE